MALGSAHATAFASLDRRNPMAATDLTVISLPVAGLAEVPWEGSDRDGFPLESTAATTDVATATRKRSILDGPADLSFRVSNLHAAVRRYAMRRP